MSTKKKKNWKDALRAGLEGGVDVVIGKKTPQQAAKDLKENLSQNKKNKKK